MPGPWEKYGGAPSAPMDDPIVKPVDTLERAKFDLSARDQALQEDAAGRAAGKDQRDQLEWNATHLPDGTPKPKASEDDDKGKIRAATLESIVGQINRVQTLYNQSIRDEGAGNLWGALDNLGPSASQFNSAGQGMADQGLAAFRVPGQGSQSDYEARQFAAANTPQAGDYDVSIEEKMRTLRARVDANRAALGLPPARWEGVEAVPAAAPQVGEDREPIPGAATPGGVDRSRNLNEIDGGGGGPAVGFDTGATRYEDDPQLEGVLSQYRARLERGDSAKDIVGYLRSAGVKDAAVFDSVRKQVEYRRRNPNVPIGNYDIAALDDKAIPQSVARRYTNAVADSAPGTAIMNVGNAVTGYSLDSLTDNPALTRAGIEEANSRSPLAAFAGQAAGGALAAGLGQNALMRGGVSALRAGLTADAAYGALAGAGASDENRLQGAGIGALAGVGGNAIGRGVTKAIGGTVRGQSDSNVNALLGNTPLTIGQAVGQGGAVGRAVKGVEDRISGIPIVGDMLNARRREGVEAFNLNSFNRALKPIGAKVTTIGEEAVQEAQDAVSQAYAKALGGKQAVADGPFAQQLFHALNKTAKLPRIGGEMADNVKTILEPYLQGTTLSGDAMQQISRELRGLKAGYAGDPLKSRIGQTIDDVEDSIFGLFNRQAPEVVPAYNRAKAAARRLYIVEDAVLKAKNKGGVFTPAQLGMADRSGMSKFGGKRGAAAGKSPFHDFQRAAQEVLPNTVPDSGTAGRLAAMALPGAVGAAAGGGVGYAGGDAGEGAAKGLTLGTALALAYSRVGQRALVAAAAKRPDAVKKAGQAIVDAGERVGALSGGAAPAILLGP